MRDSGTKRLGRQPKTFKRAQTYMLDRIAKKELGPGDRNFSYNARSSAHFELAELLARFAGDLGPLMDEMVDPQVTQIYGSVVAQVARQLRLFEDE
jgi:hypothetical protein